MKRFLVTLLTLAMTVNASMGAATNVTPNAVPLTINYTNYSIMFPTNAAGVTNWFTTNDIARASVHAADKALQALTNASLQAQITGISSTNGYVTTNQWVSLSNRVTVLEATTGTLTKAGLYISGNAYVSSNLVATGTVTAASFIGNGSGLTNISATATGAVTKIVVGAVTNTGAITFLGKNVSAGSGTVTFTNMEYLSATIVPSIATYEYYWFGPRDENITLVSTWARSDPYAVVYSIVSCASNSLWRAHTTTNLADISAEPTGVYATNFTTAAIASNTWFGIKMESSSDPRATAFSFQLKIAY